MATKDEALAAEREHAQMLAELHRSGAEMFQGAIGQLAIVAGQLAQATRPPATPDTRTLDERMAAVQAELEDVPRRGHAEIQTRSGGTYSYDYITEADLMTGVRPLLAKHGIATYYSDEILSIDSGMARVRVTLKLRAAGEELELHGDGVGTDLGDKHANKAKTAAMRYLLWKTFLQPSDEDPEQENVSASEAAGAQRGRETAAEARRPPAARRGAETAESRKARVLQRINQLTVELDEIQGRNAGSTLGKLHDDVQLEHGIAITELDEAALVDIGQALGLHVTGQRQVAESGGEAVDTFEPPKPGAAGE